MTLLKSIFRAPSRRALFPIAAALVIGGGWIPQALATPPVGVTTTILAGPVAFDKFGIHVMTDTWKIQIRTSAASDFYVVDNVFDPAGNTGWHSHPGPSLVTVVSGTITAYEGDDPNALLMSIPPARALSTKAARMCTSCETRPASRPRRLPRS